jgi:hypothetical protein
LTDYHSLLILGDSNARRLYQFCSNDWGRNVTFVAMSGLTVASINRPGVVEHIKVHKPHPWYSSAITFGFISIHIILNRHPCCLALIISIYLVSINGVPCATTVDDCCTQ